MKEYVDFEFKLLSGNNLFPESTIKKNRREILKKNNLQKFLDNIFENFIVSTEELKYYPFNVVYENEIIIHGLYNFSLEKLYVRNILLNNIRNNIFLGENYIILIIVNIPDEILLIHNNLMINPEYYTEVSEDIKKDKNMILWTLYNLNRTNANTNFRNELNIFLNIPSELFDDRTFVLEILKINESYIEYMDDKYRNDREIIFNVIKHKNRIKIFIYISNELKEDFHFMFQIIKENPEALAYVSDNFKDDPKMALAAVKSYGSALYHVSQYLQGNRRIVLAAVKDNPKALIYAADHLKDDYIIVKIAVKNFGPLLFHASKDLQNNFKIVFEAVKQNGCALQYASEQLRNDPKIVLEAVKQSGHFLKFASEQLRDNLKFVLAAFNCNKHVLAHISTRLQNNEKIILAASK